MPKFINEIEYTVISFSGSKSFYDQLLSLYSFYANVGKPKKWIIYSDGTYTDEQINRFQKICGVLVYNLESLNYQLPIDVILKFPTLNKVEILSKHISEKRIIFTDSDILYYKCFPDLKTINTTKNYFLVDERNNYFDDEFLLQYPGINFPFNFGFLVLNDSFEMNSIFSYIENRYDKNILNYWSDQTAFQIHVMNDANFLPLNKNDFKVGGTDSFCLSHCVDYKKIALRHFVGPIRHKMWQYSWKKVLDINK